MAQWESSLRVSSVHTVVAALVEVRWGKPGPCGSARAPFFLAAGAGGWRWLYSKVVAMRPSP